MSNSLIWSIVLFVLGINVGSFLNVCISRLPKDESIIFPSSHCPKCEHRLNFFDLIPLLSYVLLLGKCRYCKTNISFRYPLVEFLTGILYVLLYFQFGLSMDLVFHILFVSILVVVAFSDLETFTINDMLNYLGIIIGILYSIYRMKFFDHILGALIGGTVFFLIRFFGSLAFKKEAMGDGDVFLAIMLGAFFGSKGIIITTYFSFIVGGIVSIFLLIGKLKNKSEAIPFGPYLVLGALLNIFLGNYFWQFFKS